jgi:hypothetical protein
MADVIDILAIAAGIYSAIFYARLALKLSRRWKD